MADLHTLVDRQAATLLYIMTQGAGRIEIRMTNSEIRRKVRTPSFLAGGLALSFWAWDFFRVWDFRFRAFDTVRQLHHVVEIILRAADLEDVHQPFVRTRDRLELLDAFELALERPGVLERGAVNDLDRAQRSQFVARQPHFPVAAATDAPEQFVIGNAGRWSGGMLERWSIENARRIRWCWRLWHRSIHAIDHLGTKRRKRAG